MSYGNINVYRGLAHKPVHSLLLSVVVAGRIMCKTDLRAEPCGCSVYVSVYMYM